MGALSWPTEIPVPKQQQLGAMNLSEQTRKRRNPMGDFLFRLGLLKRTSPSP